PWLNNCVGFYNHGYFLRFIISVGFSSSYCLFLFGLYMRHLILSQSPYLYQMKDFDRFYTVQPNNLALVVMVLDILVLFILLLTVGILSLWQLYYAACNTTTIESLENEKIDKLVKKGVISSSKRYPYDLGSSLENIKTVLGPRVLFWWIPCLPTGDGLSFPINPALLKDALVTGEDDNDQEEVDLSWPPQEYYDYKAGKIPVGSTYRSRNAGGRSSSSSSPSKKAVEEAFLDSTEDEDEEDGASSDSSDPTKHGMNNPAHLNQHQRRRIVRRGSEGYLIRDSRTVFQTQSHGLDTQDQDGDVGSESDSENDDDDDNMPLVDLKRKKSP
ncbi:UNVERIFIED_CONTAM: Palmitoyltransferase, partial [Siphonaria sp. JEL0065]